MFKHRENLQKYFLRYYYNALYLKKLENNNQIENKEKDNKEEDKKELVNNNNIINRNINRNIDEIKVEYKDRNLYTEEELRRVKRNKELRDLFYNKIRERQNYLHKCFTRFYYKGLMLYMKNLNSQKATNDTTDNNNNINNNTINEISTTKNNNEENNGNTNNNLNNQNVNETQPKPENPYTKARQLRKLLNRKAKEKIELLRKYFYKFQRAGIYMALRKGTKRASFYKQIEGVDLETAFLTVTKSVSMNEIEIDENSNAQNFQEALEKKREAKKLAKEREKNKIEEEKNRKIEEDKKKELNKMKQKAIEILLYKADKHNRDILKKNFEIFYLKSKVMSLKNYDIRKTRTKKGKKGKKKRQSVILNADNVFTGEMAEFRKFLNEEKLQDVKSEDEFDKENEKETNNYEK